MTSLTVIFWNTLRGQIKIKNMSSQKWIISINYDKITIFCLLFQNLLNFFSNKKNISFCLLILTINNTTANKVKIVNILNKHFDKKIL